MADRETDYLWDPRAPADPEIARLEDALRPLRHGPAREPVPEVARPAFRPRRRLYARYPLAAAVLIAALGVWRFFGVERPHWHVTPTAGTPRVAGRLVTREANTIRPGEWLETDARSSARVAVGLVGRADVGPDARLRLVRAGGAEYRMALARGRVHARIWAPPRFVLVETPGALAIDLGCVYTLELDDAGAGILRVESGEVELADGAVRSLVPAGSAAAIRPGRGPGVPYSLRASDGFRTALAALETLDPSAPPAARGAALDTLLGLADSTSVITLWHLLPRVDVDARMRVYGRLAALAPPPAGVDAVGVARLDRAMLARWRDRLEPAWSTERVTTWRRAWRKGWAWIMRR